MVQEIITWLIVAAAVVWIVKRIYDRTRGGGCNCGCGCGNGSGSEGCNCGCDKCR